MANSLEGAERKQYGQFIDGKYQSSSGDKRIVVDYPYTGEDWAEVPNGTAADVNRAVTAANEAFYSEAWRSFRRDDRQDLLYDIADVLDDHVDELARLESRENGGLLSHTRARVSQLGDNFRHFGDLCTQLDERVVPVEKKNGEMFNYVKKEPYGVVGAITPWNAPLNLSVIKIAPALAAGNTVVHKPSEETPVGAFRLAELIYEKTEIPAGVYNVLGGDGDTGAALADHDGLNKLAFTGSTKVGRAVGSKAGEKIIPVTLELGGKSPNIVFESADIDNAVNGVMKGVFTMSGQYCMAGSRILVQNDVYDEFLELFEERAAKVTVGDPMDPDTDIGPIAFCDQWEKVREYIEAGAEEAKLVFGGGEPDDAEGNYLVEPTIIADVENDMTVAQNEIFGPVASVIRFENEEEAIEIANDTEYGLAAGVWSGETAQAQRVANRIEAGTVWINEYSQLSVKSPVGGFKDSGVGREFGEEGLSEYVQTKSIWIDHSDDIPNRFE